MLWAVGLFHLAIVACAFSQAGDLWRFPIRNDDSAAHFYAAVHAADHWRRSGALWGYDPFWMAGYPEGVVSLVDNKLFEVIVGFTPPRWQAAAYNATFLLVILAPPWVLYAAGRASGASRTAATGAALCAVIASFTIPLTLGFLVWGGVSYFLSAVLVVPATLLLARAVTRGGIVSVTGLAALSLGSFTIFVHPAVLPVLCSGVGRAFLPPKKLRRRHLVDALSIAVALAVPLLSLIAARVELRKPLRSIDPQGTFMGGGLAQLKEDWWTHLLRIDGSPHGAGGLLGLALLACAALWAGAGNAPDDETTSRRRTVLWSAAACIALAYGASSLAPRIASLQPSRFIVVLAFFLCLPAGEAVAGLLSPARRLGPCLLGLVGLAVAAHAGLALGPLLAFGVGADPAEDALVRLLEREGNGGGRTLVESSFERLPAAPGAALDIPIKRFALLPLRAEGEFLGYGGTGPITVQRYAAFGEGRILSQWLGRLEPAELATLLRRYAITRVVACASPTLRALHRFPDVLQQRESLGDCWAFQVRDPAPSRLLEGNGAIHASLDRIEVRGTESERIVLKYHWIPTLRTEPPLPIDEAPQPRAPVGFIAVRPGGVRDFDVVNSPPPTTQSLARFAWRGVLAALHHGG